MTGSRVASSIVSEPLISPYEVSVICAVAIGLAPTCSSRTPRRTPIAWRYAAMTVSVSTGVAGTSPTLGLGFSKNEKMSLMTPLPWGFAA